ncbi:MAG: nitronate monooxygenase, partial [Candidatus Spyradocola sp.]
MIRTEICDMLGIEYPIFQGGMAWVSDASLAGAVSNAGGLGIIAGMNSNGEQLRAEIRKIRQITDKPFGVNVMLLSPFADEVAQVVVEEKVPVVVTGAGLPTKYIKTWVAAGLKVIPVVPSVAIARMCERMGACAVVAEGGESGGHVGDLTTMALTPQVVDAVRIPVLAAGGIGDGRGVAAALMLGAKGVQVGTRFIATHECDASDAYKEVFLRASAEDIVIIDSPVGLPGRAIRNAFVERMLREPERITWCYNCLRACNPATAKYCISQALINAVRGDVEHGLIFSGAKVGQIDRIQSVREIIGEIV